MKRTIFALAICLMMASCIGGSTNSSNTKTECSTCCSKSYKIDELLSRADSLVGKEVVVVGSVTHTCKHSGKRCFIIGDDQKTTMRIEAKGEIGGFNRELIGSELAIKGILRENRLTNEYLDAWEQRVKDAMGEEDGSAESCSAETNNIANMRAWMKKNNKEYYSLLYMDGESYEVVE